ncbi:MAG: tetratricopeptide repeat protein [Saprospiraceae bacterium]|nr:tetratricopeptide repeat protein [Saprospiraceae bacterium]
MHTIYTWHVYYHLKGDPDKAIEYYKKASVFDCELLTIDC